MDDSRGVIFFNRGEKCIVRAIVCFYTLRLYYSGSATIYLENPYPKEFDNVCKYFNIDIIYNDERPDLAALVRKTDMFGNPPYDRTLWLDLDTIICGSIDEMFDSLDDADVCIPNFCDWVSTGSVISRRIKRFQDIVQDKYMEKALMPYPALNTGVLSFKRSSRWMQFVTDWVMLASKGSEAGIFIPDETAAQVLFPSIEEWGLKCKIVDKKYNVSVRFGKDIQDKRIVHFHGQKHASDFALSYLWKDVFNEMSEKNTANINGFLQHADKRLGKWLKGGKKSLNLIVNNNKPTNDVTIVTACDEYYVDILRETFPNWRKYKNIDAFPVIVFVHGIKVGDPRIEFLNLPNVRIIPWKMDNADNHREEMLSAFVFGTAENVQTPYWLKLDADSYATDYKPLFSEEMKKFGFCGHKWGYSRPEHIKKLDEWAKNHWQKKLKNAPPMITEGRVDGNRFYHNKKRTISFIQLHTTKFTKFCCKLFSERKLPAPTQDTTLFYILDRMDPHLIGTANFKKNHGFTQGKGKMGANYIKECVTRVDEINRTDVDTSNIEDQDIEDTNEINSEG